MTVRILLREKEIVMSRKYFDKMLDNFDTHDLLDCVYKNIETDEIKIDKSVDCVDCEDCMDCTRCSDCNECTDCTECYWCDSCTNCVDCDSCEGLVDCVGWRYNKPPIGE